MARRIDRRTWMRLAAGGLSSALIPLGGGCAGVGQNDNVKSYPTPGRPITPVPDWYNVSIQGAYEADRADYRLKVSGAVDDALRLSLDDLARFPKRVAPSTLACVGNPPGGGLISSGWFGGALVRDVLDAAGVDDRVSGALITGLDGFASYQSLDDLRRGESIFAYEIGQSADELEPLPVDRGFPCRLLTPGLYGYMQPKWIDTVEMVEHDGSQGVISRSIGYFAGKMQLASGLSRPLPRETVTAGDYELLGYAFGDGRPIETVELSFDGGAWQPAEIVFDERGDDERGYLWVLWRFPWKATVSTTVRIRATMSDGTTQFEGVRLPYSGGAIASRRIVVAEGA